LSFTSHGNLSQDGWNLIGNPYTSSFNTDQYLSLTNTDRAIYSWDENRYRVWNGIAGSIPGGIIPPATSFFVKANSANASVAFQKEGKIHDFSHFSNPVNLPDNVLKIEISNLDNPVFKDEAFLLIMEGSSPAYDPAFDAHKLQNGNGNAEIFFRSGDGVDCAIASIPDAYESLAGVRIPANDAYVIHTQTSNLPPDLPIYIIDNELELTKDLRAEDYVFLADEGYYPERFLIVLTDLGINDGPGDFGIRIYSSDGQIKILSQENIGKSVVTVFDLTGRQISNAEISLEKGKQVRLHGIAGFNLVRVVSGEAIVTQKLFLAK
jgi:hypothetical protein